LKGMELRKVRKILQKIPTGSGQGTQGARTPHEIFEEERRKREDVKGAGKVYEERYPICNKDAEMPKSKKRERSWVIYGMKGKERLKMAVWGGLTKNFGKTQVCSNIGREKKEKKAALKKENQTP